MTERTIKVKALSRVEGEGGLYIRMTGDAVNEVKLEIYEPPRLFEALLRGRPLEEVPDFTARICGICPVAYQMSSVHALEAALGLAITPEIRQYRRLLYCGEWIESHALHVYLLNAPDFLGYESGLEMARDFPDEVQRGLRLKKYGNELLEVLGGRAIHPINVCVGGFYRWPASDALRKLIPKLEWSLDAAVETTRWVSRFEFPDFQRDYQLVSLSHPDEYPMNEGRIANIWGESIDVADFDREFEERHVAHSTALHCVRRQTGASYLAGPLARIGLNVDRLSPTARKLAEEVGIDWPSHNPFQSIVARGIELIHAFEEALLILRSDPPRGPSRVPITHKEGEGSAATEAPRGLLYHRYQVDGNGKVRHAVIVPPTSQNQGQIEHDLRAWVPRIISPDEAITSRQCENLVRCYDPCISCSTHFLNVRIDRS
ncbi:MAG: Ni/Fe hydrogenase subunit alpha [Planctomycetaceae bacterium]